MDKNMRVVCGLGFFLLAVCLACGPGRSASAAPACYGCECISPADCDGCRQATIYKRNGEADGTVYVKVTGSKYYTCYRTSTDADCSTFELACYSFAGGAGGLVTYKDDKCAGDGDTIVILPAGSSVQFRRTGCGTVSSQATAR